MFRYADFLRIHGENEAITDKIISDGTEIIEGINNTEKEYASVEDTRLYLNKMSKLLFLKFQNIINEKNIVIAPA